MLIGIHGKKRSGKDTVARMIATISEQERGELCAITHYATTLKNGAAALFEIDVKHFYDDDLKEKVVEELGVTPRKIMTDMHDAMVPVFGHYVFVDPVRRQWASWKQKSKGHFIVADVRYEGRETDWIRNEGGIIVHVFRESADNVAVTHSSEAGIPVRVGDIILWNDGTKKELEDQVRAKIFSG